MIRKAFVMSLKPGCEEDYKKRHQPIWPELEIILREHGVVSYSIFLHQDKRQLLAYAEIEDEDRWKAIADTEVCKKWWKWMSEIMDTHEDMSPLAIDCSEVFHLTRSQGQV